MSKRSREEDFEDSKSIEEVKYDNVNSSTNIVCTFPPCHLNSVILGSYLEYEDHIRRYHDNRCNSCFKNFPSEEFLNVHIEENHNPFLIIQKEKGMKVYKCLKFNQGCAKTCSSQRKRNLHMIYKHGYPKNFDFEIINRGFSSNRMSLLTK